MEELMQMRGQMEIMKQRLDESRIVNERLMRQVMSHKASFLNNLVLANCIAIPVIALLLVGICSIVGCTLWIVWSFLIMAVVSLFIDFKTVRISPREICSVPFNQLRIRLIKQKQTRKLQMLIETPLAMVWSVWYIIELFGLKQYVGEGFFGNSEVCAALISLAVMLVVSVAIIVWIYKKMQRINDNLISQIDDSQD